MSTTKSIGTSSRDYSTIQAWEDAVPATPTGGYIGECYNDSEFTAGVTIAGHTTSAANFITLTAAAGQSFQDHASVRTNPLIYDQSKGVGIKNNAAHTSSAGVYVVNSYVTVSRLQVQVTGTTGPYLFPCYLSDSGLTNVVFRDSILWWNRNTAVASGNNVQMAWSLSAAAFYNLVVYNTQAGYGGNGMQMAAGSIAENCTVDMGAGSSGAGSYGIALALNVSDVKNCIVTGFNVCYSTTSSGASDYNLASDATAPGAHSLQSKTAANQFVSAGTDYRLKAGADAINTGNTDATNAPNDISGTARGAGTAGDIGAWEYVSPSSPWLYAGAANAAVIQSGARAA